MTDWTAYRDAVASKAPHDTVVRALAAWDRDHPGGGGGRALDLGCGAGRDTVELLRRGWHVVAIDADAAAIAALRARPDLPATGTLDARCERMETATVPAVDLIVASYALRFCPADQFFALWQRLTAALATGGRFAGHVYGTHDDWIKGRGLGFDRAELDTLFTAFEIEHIVEVDAPGTDAVGNPRHRHVFDVVARKR